MIADRGIRVISTKLTALLSLNMWCDDHVSEESFHFLSSNCPLLSDLRARLDLGSSICLHHFYSFVSTLSSLCLHKVNITETGLAHLSDPNFKLWKLILTSPQYSRHSVGMPVLHRVRKLVMIGWDLSDKILMLIGFVCYNLEKLIVHNSSDITDRGIEAIRASCCRINRLEVTDCSGVDLATKKIVIW